MALDSGAGIVALDTAKAVTTTPALADTSAIQVLTATDVPVQPAALMLCTGSSFIASIALKHCAVAIAAPVRFTVSLLSTGEYVVVPEALLLAMCR